MCTSCLEWSLQRMLERILPILTRIIKHFLNELRKKNLKINNSLFIFDHNYPGSMGDRLFQRVTLSHNFNARGKYNHVI